MTLKEFIAKLEELSARYPDAEVPNPERYTISVIDSLASKGTAKLMYNWREAEQAERDNQRNLSLQNSLR